MMEPIARVLILAIVALGATTARAQQGPERSSQASQGRPTAYGAMPMPRPGVAGDMNASLEAQRPAWEAYQRCIRENQQAFNLSSITRTMIEMRNGKERYLALLNDPKTSAAFKGKSYDESVAEGMTEYRRLGGMARSIDEISAMPNPCAEVEPGPKPPPNRAGPASGSSLSARASATPVLTDVRPEASPSRGTAVIGAADGVKWVRVGDSFASVNYLDPSSIKKVPRTDKSEKDEDIRQATEMTDFKIKAPDGPVSYISTGEYDCKSSKTRYRSGNAYAGPAGTGKILYATTPSDWTSQPPNSPAIPVLKLVCAVDLSTSTKLTANPDKYQAPSAPAKSRSEPVADKVECVIKPVMTNADMAKCH